MLTSEDVKQAGRAMGADLVGIADLDRFEGAPKQQDPRYIFPDAEALIAFAFRLPRGYFRGIEEGTYFAAYASMGYGGMNLVYMPGVLREMCCFIEDHGWEAAPIPNNYPGTSISFATQEPTPERARPVREGLPFPDILPDFRVAAVAAGLGELGYSKLLLTPQFGPRQRLVLMLTDAPLEPDPMFDGEICDRCMACVESCPGEAISTKETDSITIAGREYEWAKLDTQKCSIGYRGGKPSTNPFLDPDVDQSLYEDEYVGGAHLNRLTRYQHAHHHNPAIGGARGCIRACMMHLEETERISNTFNNPFRRRRPWRL